ncbi:MAG TPA: protein translocase subunit SecF [Candidatus Polarisedimenticolia bacterium]|nr:protein translocase subunit SecF [Candidatus Polarisedimenticolia bacterium]
MKQLQLLTNANFNIMGKKFLFISISVVAMAASLAALVTRGLNWGVDFRGGTEVRVRFMKEPPTETIRKELEGLKLGDVNLQAIGKPEENELMIRVAQKEGEAAKQEGGLVGSGDVSQQVLKALSSERDRSEISSGKIDVNQASVGSLRDWLDTRLGAGKSDEAERAAEATIEARNARGGMFRSLEDLRGIASLSPEIQTALSEGTFVGDVAVRSMEYVGPSAGRDLVRKATWAVVLSNIGILIYIWIRFRFIWGIAGVIALVHDVVIALGGLALTQKEFSLPVVAALLTIVGYSINDTVVVFDRIRENLRLHRTKEYELVVNASINQTFSRTILTQLTVLICTAALYLYGGDRLDALSFTLLVGFISGAYSSIFVASPILVMHQRWWNERKRRKV